MLSCWMGLLLQASRLSSDQLARELEHKCTHTQRLQCMRKSRQDYVRCFFILSFRSPIFSLLLPIHIHVNSKLVIVFKYTQVTESGQWRRFAVIYAGLSVLGPINATEGLRVFMCTWERDRPHCHPPSSSATCQARAFVVFLYMWDVRFLMHIAMILFHQACFS